MDDRTVFEEETPYCALDVDVVESRYLRLVRAFGQVQVFYAVKANPDSRILRRLVEKGACFDVASVSEIDDCLSQGARPGTLAFGNTIKKSKDIRYAYERGVRTFTFDSEPELLKIAEHAPGAKVFCRILASSEGSRFPLRGKFGCDPDMAVELLTRAAVLGLEPVGVSFHVGSQQLEPLRWGPSVAQAAWIFKTVGDAGIGLRFLNVGGGFPVSYLEPAPPVEEFGSAIDALVRQHFSGPLPRLAVEPGRYIAADAGAITAEVVLISRRSRTDAVRWVYLDVGRFGGLVETGEGGIRYRIATPHDGRPTGPAIVAGPTCDGTDIMNESSFYHLPLALEVGDRVQIQSAGAYTTTCSSIAFNGFAPLRAVVKQPRSKQS